MMQLIPAEERKNKRCHYCCTCLSVKYKIPVEELDRVYSGSETYDVDVIYYVPTKNYGTLFKAAYANMEELESEFRTKFNKYLPDDFDYRKHIRHIIGTYYG